jgi:hypothetical protein
MVQIVNRGPSIGQLFGEGFGAGASQTLTQRLQDKRQQKQMDEGLAKLDELGDIEDMDMMSLQKEIFKAFPGNPELAQKMVGNVYQSKIIEAKAKSEKLAADKEKRELKKGQAHISRLEKRLGVEAGTLGEDVKNAEFLFKEMKEKKEDEKKALKLNEELNQQKSRTKAKVDDLVRPYGMVDPFTRMITWNKNVGEKERATINKKIEKERAKSMKTQKSLYKLYGHPVPEDLEEEYLVEDSEGEEESDGRSEKVNQTMMLLQKLMSK